jgi:two-component system response regulator FixJ
LNLFFDGYLIILWQAFSRSGVAAMSPRQTIHVIDDDAAMRNSLHALLVAEGYVVHSHESAQTFINTIQKGDAGCIVTDLNMPQMSGLDLLCEMCARRMCMPAIVISGRLDAQLIQATKEQGAFRCFQKPFDPGTLLAAIHAALVDAYGGDQNPALSG